MTLENQREKIQDLKMRYTKDAKMWYRQISEKLVNFFIT